MHTAIVCVWVFVCMCECVCWGVSLASNVSGFRFYINISHGNWIQAKLA